MMALFPLVARVGALVAVVAVLGVAVAVDHAPLLGRWRAAPMPDLLLCLVALLRLRRPWLLPVPLVFVAGLGRDLLSGGAVGPGALALALVADALSRRAAVGRRIDLVRELAAVAAAAAVVLLVPVALLLIAFAEAPGWGDLGARWLATVAAYAVIATVVPFGRGGVPRPGADVQRAA